MKIAIAIVLATAFQLVPAMAQGQAARGQQPAAAASPNVREIRLRSAAIARNLVGESAEQTVLVYLPPGYDRNATRRYPVLYLLHGIVDSPETWIRAWRLPALLDQLMASGVAEMIVVMPNGRNQFLGSYYRNSPVTGGWEDFIKRELVGHVDSAFRTLASRERRAVAGHSMGGFGALQLAMRAPEVFGIAYAMSPCCLDFVEDIGYGNGVAWRGALAFRSVADIVAAAGLAASGRGEVYPVVAYGLAAATIPAPTGPLFVEWPVREVSGELMPQLPIWHRWRDEAPVRLVPRYAANLRSMKALAIDYGLNDQFAHIPPATAAFTHALAEHRVPHVLEVFEGDHRELFRKRLAERVLPFLSFHLRAGQ